MIQLTGLPADFRAATAFAFTPDGRQLSVGYQTNDPLNWSALWWDWAANRVARERRGPTLTLGGDGLFVSTLDRTKIPVVQVCTADGETPIASIPVDDSDRTLSVPAHVVAPGGEEVVVEHAGRLGFHRLPDGSEVASSKVGKGNTWMEFSPSARWLFCRSTRAVRLWDRRNKHKLVRLKSDSYTTAAVSADDTYAAVTGPTGQAVTVWELATQAEVLRIELSFIAQGLAWLPGGRLMLTAGREGVQIWDVGAKKECFVFTPPGGMGTRLTVSPDGLVAAALMYERAGATAVVWDL